jgi:hypothetical protein
MTEYVPDDVPHTCAAVGGGELEQVCNRWLFSSCVCFALDLRRKNARIFGMRIRSIKPSTAATCFFSMSARWSNSFKAWWSVPAPG